MWLAWSIITVILIVLYGLKYGHYYIKFIFFCISATIGSTLCLFLFIFRPWSVENFKIANATARFVGRCLRLKIQVNGKHNLESAESFILLVNHQSSLDIFVLAHIWPERCTILAKKEIFWGGPYGLGCWLCGCVFVDRQNSSEAKKTVNEALDKIIKNKLKIIVFPEGTRHSGDTLLPFKKGAFHMAVNGKLPIIPVVVSSYSHFLSHEKKIFNEGLINVTCLPPVRTDSLGISDIDALASETRELMQAHFLTTFPHFSTNNENNDKSD